MKYLPWLLFDGFVIVVAVLIKVVVVRLVVHLVLRLVPLKTLLFLLFPLVLRGNRAGHPSSPRPAPTRCREHFTFLCWLFWGVFGYVGMSGYFWQCLAISEISLFHFSNSPPSFQSGLVSTYVPAHERLRLSPLQFREAIEYPGDYNRAGLLPSSPPIGKCLNWTMMKEAEPLVWTQTLVSFWRQLRWSVHYHYLAHWVLIGTFNISSGIVSRGDRK